MSGAGENIHALTGHLFRESSGKITSVLTRIFGLQQIETVMDAVQDTFEAALRNWRYSGVPANPEAWLMKVARNKAISALRKSNKVIPASEALFTRKAAEDPEAELVLLPGEVEDSQLRLLLTCCHPDFSERNQIILTLNVLCGFGVTEIAGALLMQAEAVKKALTRMKQQLKEKKNVLLTPRLPNYEKRVETVQTILYLMYNEGYKTSRGKAMIDHDLCYEAIRLSKLLLQEGVALAAETQALLALMFFNLARFPARMNSEGEIITLAEQDRSKWNKVFIEEGYRYLNEVRSPEKLNRYYLEAIIASLHCRAKSFHETDWQTIVYLYTQLETLSDSPLLRLNRIVAESYIDPLKSLEALRSLKEQELLKDHYLVYAAEGDLFLRTNNLAGAKTAFLEAERLATSPLDKQYLLSRIARC